MSDLSVDDVGPARNLPEGAEKWGRDKDIVVGALRKEVARLRQQLENLARAVGGGLAMNQTILNVIDEGDLDGVFVVDLERGAISIDPSGNGIVDAGQIYNPDNYNVTGTGDSTDTTINSGIVSIALMGGRVTSDATNAIAIGTDGVATDLRSVAIHGLADGEDSIAIGALSVVRGHYSIALGRDIEVLGDHVIAIGRYARSLHEDGDGGTVIGMSATINAAWDATAVGSYTTVTANEATAVGTSAEAHGEQASAFGYSAIAYGEGAVAVGNASFVEGENAIVVGANSSAYAESATAVGESSTATRYAAIALGSYATAAGGEATSIGPNSTALAPRSTAIGPNAMVNAPSAMALGDGAIVGTRERAGVAARDIEVKRSPAGIAGDDGTYGSSPETGIILTDAAGARWRITVGTDGTLHADAPGTWDAHAWDDTGAPGAFWSLATISADGTKLAACVDSGAIWTSTDSGATWTERPSSGTPHWTDIVSSSDGTKLVATPGTYATGQIRVSLDSGATWTAKSAPGTRLWLGAGISADGATMIAYAGNQLWVSTNSGSTWTQRMLSSFLSSRTLAMSADASTIAFITVGRFAVDISTDLGATWTTNSPGIEAETEAAQSADPIGIAIGANGDFIAVSFRDGYISATTDAAETWTWAEDNRETFAIAGCSDDGAELLATNESGLFTSSDHGLTWQYVNNSASTAIGTIGYADIGYATGGDRKVAVLRTNDWGQNKILTHP